MSYLRLPPRPPPAPPAGTPHTGWFSLEREIADELGRQHAQEDCPGRYCARRCSPACRNVCFSRTTTFMAYVVLLVCLLVSIGALIFTYGEMVAPQLRLKHFVKTNCTVTGTEYFTNLSVSTAPCLRVQVLYSRYGGSQVATMLLSTQLNQLCTYHRDSDIKDYIDTYGDGYANFPCRYNPMTNSTEVVMTSNPPIISEVAWPLAILCGFILGLITVCFTCGCRYICLKDAPRNIQVTASVLHHQHKIYSLKTLPVFERQRTLRECMMEAEFDSNEEESGL